MKFGLGTITRGVFSSGEAYTAVAQAAEKAGFDYIAVTDHLVVPRKYDSHYPYVPGGRFAIAEQGYCLDQLSTVAYIAACTRTLRILTSVLVIPHRPTMLTAKMLATIDVLSNGRLIVGAGAGWMKEEFELLDAPFETRGKYTDETLEAFVELWTKEEPKYKGEQVSFDNVVFSPKPVQRPHPPFWIGGESGPALRRAIRMANSWYPGNNSQTKPLDTADRLGAAYREVKDLAAKMGRDPSTLGLALLVQDHFEWQDHKTFDGSARRMFTGSSDDMIEDAKRLEAVGLGHATLRLGGATLSETLERVERFGKEVIARM